MSKKDKRVSQVVAQSRSQGGLDRKHFFESNGDLAQWRGRPSVQIDRKKARDRKKCRGKVVYE